MEQLGISRCVEAAISTSVLLVPRAKMHGLSRTSIVATAWLVMVISGRNNTASSAFLGLLQVNRDSVTEDAVTIRIDDFRRGSHLAVLRGGLARRWNEVAGYIGLSGNDLVGADGGMMWSSHARQRVHDAQDQRRTDHNHQGR
jgi:hypothetical protein